MSELLYKAVINLSLSSVELRSLNTNEHTADGFTACAKRKKTHNRSPWTFVVWMIQTFAFERSRPSPFLHTLDTAYSVCSQHCENSTQQPGARNTCLFHPVIWDVKAIWKTCLNKLGLQKKRWRWHYLGSFSTRWLLSAANAIRIIRRPFICKTSILSVNEVSCPLGVKSAERNWISIQNQTAAVMVCANVLLFFRLYENILSYVLRQPCSCTSTSNKCYCMCIYMFPCLKEVLMRVLSFHWKGTK